MTTLHPTLYGIHHRTQKLLEDLAAPGADAADLVFRALRDQHVAALGQARLVAHHAEADDADVDETLYKLQKKLEQPTQGDVVASLGGT